MINKYQMVNFLAESKVLQYFSHVLVCYTYITLPKQWKPGNVPVMDVSIVVVGALTCCTLLHPVYDLKTAQKKCKLKLAAVEEGDPKAPFSIATTPKCREGRYSFPWTAPLYPWSVPFNVEF